MKFETVLIQYNDASMSRVKMLHKNEFIQENKMYVSVVNHYFVVKWNAWRKITVRL